MFVQKRSKPGTKGTVFIIVTVPLLPVPAASEVSCLSLGHILLIVVGPKSLSLKCDFSSFLTLSMSCIDLLAMVTSSMKTGMMICVSSRLNIQMLCSQRTLWKPIFSNTSFSFLSQHLPACFSPYSDFCSCQIQSL